MLKNSLLKWYRIKKLDRHTSFFCGTGRVIFKYVSFTNRYSGLYFVVQMPPKIRKQECLGISQVNKLVNNAKIGMIQPTVPKRGIITVHSGLVNFAQTEAGLFRGEQNLEW